VARLNGAPNPLHECMQKHGRTAEVWKHRIGTKFVDSVMWLAVVSINAGAKILP
jgi:hypothetical protein